MPSSTPRFDRIICNTTPMRIFALVNCIDVLIGACDGELLVPRVVLDPDDVPGGPEELQSEIGRAEHHWSKRATGPEAVERLFRLQALRTNPAISVVDLEELELARFAQLQSPQTQRRFDLALPLGPGEAAVMAVAENRGWAAGIDDGAARRVLGHDSPGTQILTSRELLRRAIWMEIVDTGEADLIYGNMLDLGYRGPPLWP